LKKYEKTWRNYNVRKRRVIIIFSHNTNGRITLYSYSSNATSVLAPDSI